MIEDKPAAAVLIRCCMYVNWEGTTTYIVEAQLLNRKWIFADSPISSVRNNYTLKDLFTVG